MSSTIPLKIASGRVSQFAATDAVPLSVDLQRPGVQYVLFDGAYTITGSDMGTHYYCTASYTFTLPTVSTAANRSVVISQASGVSYVDVPGGGTWEDGTSARTTINSNSSLFLVSHTVSGFWIRQWLLGGPYKPQSIVEDRRMLYLLG